MDRAQSEQLSQLVQKASFDSDLSEKELVLSDFQVEKVPSFCHEITKRIEEFMCFETIPQDFAIIGEFNRNIEAIQEEVQQDLETRAALVIDGKRGLELDAFADKENCFFLDYDNPMNLAKNQIDKITLESEEKDRLFKDCTNTMYNRDHDTDSADKSDHLECTDEILPPQTINNRTHMAEDSLVLDDEAEFDQDQDDDFAEKLLRNLG